MIQKLDTADELILPDEVWIQIFKDTSLRDKRAARATCRGMFKFFQRQAYLLEKKILWDSNPRIEAMFDVQYPSNNNLIKLVFVPGSSTLVVCTANLLALLDCETFSYDKIVLSKESCFLCSVSENFIALYGTDSTYQIYSIHNRKQVLSIKQSKSMRSAVLSKNRLFVRTANQIIYYDLTDEDPQPHTLSVEFNIEKILVISDNELILEHKKEKAALVSSYYYFNINEPKNNRMIVNDALEFVVLNNHRSYYITKQFEVYEWRQERPITLLANVSQFASARIDILNDDSLLITESCNKIGGSFTSIRFYTENSVKVYSISAKKIIGNYSYNQESYSSFVASSRGHFAHVCGSAQGGDGKYYIINVRSYFNQDTVVQDTIVPHLGIKTRK